MVQLPFASPQFYGDWDCGTPLAECTPRLSGLTCCATEVWSVCKLLLRIYLLCLGSIFWSKHVCDRGRLQSWNQWPHVTCKYPQLAFGFVPEKHSPSSLSLLSTFWGVLHRFETHVKYLWHRPLTTARFFWHQASSKWCDPVWSNFWVASDKLMIVLAYPVGSQLL